jgi:tRNA-dihydrouridine synthase
MLLRHLDMLIAEKGERTAILEMRKHSTWYLKGVRGSSGLRGKLNVVATPAELRALLTAFRTTVFSA